MFFISAAGLHVSVCATKLSRGIFLPQLSGHGTLIKERFMHT